MSEGVHNGNTSSATAVADNGEGLSRHRNAVLPTVKEVSTPNNSRLTLSYNKDKVIKEVGPIEPPSH